MRKISSAGLVLVLFITGLANAQDPPKRDKAAEQKAAMDAMMRAATPGAEHKTLDFMVGTWDTKVKFWPEAGGQPMESAGTSVNEWVLGGRWVQQKFEGSMMGMPFHGIGYSGYDNIRKTYVGTWMDNMSTQIMTSSGTGGAGNNWSFTATGVDPVSGEPSIMEEKVRIIDKDNHVFEMWGPDMDGRIYKMMEITYSRKKK
jgi:Protein of unknown function (DUF1579)